MENAEKAIMIGVGLFITIIIIAAVMLIVGMGQDLLNKGTKQLSGISSQLESQLTADYDNTTLTGAQVLSTAKTYYNSTELGILIYNSSTGFYTFIGAYGMGLSPTVSQSGPLSGWRVDFQSNNSVDGLGPCVNNNKALLSDLTNPSNKGYISTTGKYKSVLVKQNDGIIGIQFYKIS